MNLTKVSRFLSLVLRHHPETIDLHLDRNGWVAVDELLLKMKKRFPISREILEEIVRADNKQRYAFDENHMRIRANQGHSISVDVELEEREPPEFLYHGTGEKYVTSINEKGLLPMSRLFVHLTEDQKTAREVGKRHGKPVIYRVRSGNMHEKGRLFYRSANHVWLTKEVPVSFLNLMDEEED